MLSLFKLPQPPTEIGEELFLYAVGKGTGENNFLREKHPTCILVLAVWGGNGRAKVGQQEYTLLQGDLLLTQCVGDVQMEGEEALQWVCVLLGGALATRYTVALTERLGNCFSAGATRAVVGTLRRIWRSVELGAAEDGYWGSAKAFALLMELYALGEQQSSISVPELVEAAVELLRTQYAYLAGIDDLADRLGVSKHHLIRQFTHYMELPPGKYLTMIRVENAKSLLESGKYNVETVAEMTGFSSANYFCKVFHRAVGCSPAKYAKKSPPRTAQNNNKTQEQMFYL